MENHYKVFKYIKEGGIKTSLFGSDVYFKFLDLELSIIADEAKEESMALCAKMGVQTEDEKLKELIKNKEWNIVKENQINQLKYQLDKLEGSKRKLIDQRMVKSIDSNIKTTSEKLSKLQSEKKQVLGKVAEDYAITYSNERLILNSFFKDKDFKYPFLEIDEMDDLDQLEIAEAFSVFYSLNKFIQEESLKATALNNYVRTVYSSCNESIFNFYGKPSCDLNFSQISLFNICSNYTHVINAHSDSLTDEIKSDYKLLDDWINANQSGKTLLEEKSKAKTSPEEAWGAETIRNQIKKKGPIKNANDFIDKKASI